MEKINGIEISDEIVEAIAGGGGYIPKSMDEFLDFTQMLQAAGNSKELIEGLIDPSTPNYDEVHRLHRA